MKWLSAMVLLLVALPLVCCSSLYAQGKKKAPPAEKSIDINTATKDQLMQIPRIGDKRSDKIIANRPYASVDELKSKGVLGEKTLEKVRPYVICGKAPAAAEPKVELEKKAEPEKKAESQEAAPSMPKEEMPKTE
jgi:hypothetical protein